MSGQKDDPDDLIAELTKLMGTENKAAPDAVSAAAPSVRIPGQPVVRIPGVAQPVASGASPAPGKFDFGQPAQPARMATQEPLANWQDRLGGRAASNRDPLAALANAAPPSNNPASSPSPTNWRQAITPAEAEAPAPTRSGFDFDFGFNRERPESPRPAPVPLAAAAAKPAPAPPKAAPAPVVQAAPARDPIAELIAAELGEMQGRSFTATPVAVPAAPASAAPAGFSAYTPAVAPAAPNPTSAPVRQDLPAAPPLAPGYAQRAAPESDRFATSPVFGLGSRPAEPAPRVELDPMDEIESLIGEAVRVELNMPQPPPQPVRIAATPVPQARAMQPAQQPAVPPLGGQYAPRRTNSLREAEGGSGSADDAILAAAAATGAEVGRLDSTYADDRPTRPTKARKAQRREPRVGEDRPSAFKQLVVPAVAGTVLLALGFSLYWALGMGHHDDKAPVLTADVSAAKTIPKPTPDTAPHSVVMDELSGKPAAPSTETLVSRDQTAGAAGTQVAAVTPPPADAAADGGLANRKVRTVTVRPDGSIVSSDDSVAGAAKLPVDRPNVPSVPGVAVAEAADAPPVAATPDATAVDPGAVPAANADTLAPATPDAGGTLDASAPIPLPPPSRSAAAGTTQVAEVQPGDTGIAPAPGGTTRTFSPKPTSSVNAVIKSGNSAGAAPMDLIGNLATQADDTTPAAPARTPAGRTTQVATTDDPGALGAPATPGGGHVQLSSQTSETGAEASANSLLKKYGSLWGGAKLSVVKVDLGAKGIYYRVMLPTGSPADAVTVCSSIKSSGGDCVANR